MTEICQIKCVALAEPVLSLDHEDPSQLRLGVSDSGGNEKGVASLCLDPETAKKLAKHLMAWAGKQEGCA